MTSNEQARADAMDGIHDGPSLESAWYWLCWSTHTNRWPICNADYAELARRDAHAAFAIDQSLRMPIVAPSLAYGGRSKS